MISSVVCLTVEKLCVFSVFYFCSGKKMSGLKLLKLLNLCELNTKNILSFLLRINCTLFLLLSLSNIIVL